MNRLRRIERERDRCDTCHLLPGSCRCWHPTVRDYQPWPTVPPRCSACRYELGDCDCRDGWFTQHEQKEAA